MTTEPDSEQPSDVRAAAREAIDEEKLLTVLEAASDADAEPDPQAAAALREATAEEATRIARRAARRARLRAREINPEDVARAREERDREGRRRRGFTRFRIVD